MMVESRIMVLEYTRLEDDSGDAGHCRTDQMSLFRIGQCCR
jgi:hypothetical protein